MLARLVLLLVAVPVLAVAASAPDATGEGGRIRVVTAAAKPAPAQSSAGIPLIVPPPAPGDPSECRMGCAQAYYFCRAGDHPDDCAPAWGQCVAACDAPALGAGAPPAP